MLYPKKIEDKLGFEQIRDLLKDKCLSDLGVAVVTNIKYHNERLVIEKLLNQTAEFLYILQSGETFPTNHYIDVSKSLKKSEVIGAFLSEQELQDISNSLKTILSIQSFLDKRKQDYPQMAALAKHLDLKDNVNNKIDEKIDSNGEIKDNATHALYKVRSDLKAKYSKVKQLLDKIYRNAVHEGFVPEGASMTVRDGRMVIPIAAEHKRRIQGFIHDESSTGQTVFIEPTAVLEGNNEIRELENAEKREVIKILTQLTGVVREHLEDLREGYRFLGLIDYIRAKALLASDLDAIKPEFTGNTDMNWKEARHPLLFLSFKKTGRKIVPLNVEMHDDQRMLIISGPNAGGKSVCLKTVGLVQYMVQCGLLVSVKEGSKMGIYDDIFIDIGDEQSLENDLSTYSSHLTNMNFFLKHSGPKSLILIDEFGTGTDPQFGGAIAEAMLESFAANRSMGLITTHYGNIKLYAEKREGVINGSMKFDLDKLEPLYELELGKPGSSFALEISKKIGLPQSIIDLARELIGKKKVDVDDLILRLEKQEQVIKERDEKLRRKEKEVEGLHQKYEELYQQLEGDKRKIISKAKQEAADLLKQTNKEIEKTIRHIKENKAQKTETRKMRDRLDKLKGEIAEKREAKPQVVEGSIEVGDNVLIVDKDVVGEVIDIRGKDAEVQIGELKSKIKLKRLQKVSNKQAKDIKKHPNKLKTIDIAQKRADFSATLDVRGKRGEEVLPMVDRFVDDALLLSLSEIKILHGKGNGILKDLIRNHLKRSQFVSSMGDEHIDRGGAGITIINLK